MYTVPRTIASRANALLECAIDIRIYLTPLHLQKLVYIDYGMYLIRGFKPLPQLEFQAWPLGPVIPSLYHYYKHLGAQDIKDKIIDENKECYTLKDKTIPKYTIQMYGHLTSTDLVRFTHIADGAWHKAFQKDKPGQKIKHEDIKREYMDYYKQSYQYDEYKQLFEEPIDPQEFNKVNA